MTDQKQILLVMNDTTASLERQLSDAGFFVSPVHSGIQAVEQLMHGSESHLIVTDITLSDMDGFEFAQTVRQWSRVPIVIVSEITDPFIIAEAITEFADDYIASPFAVEELAARINRILRYYP